MGRQRPDSLTAHEKDALHFQISELVKAEEPIAMLGCLRRIAESMAWRGVVNDNREAAEKWTHLAEAVVSVSLAIRRPDLSP